MRVVQSAGQSLCSISEARTIKLWKFSCDNCIINLTDLSPPGVSLLTINGLWVSQDLIQCGIDWISSGNRAWVINGEARELLLCYALWTRTKLSIQVLNAHINVGHGWTPHKGNTSRTRDLSLATNQRLELTDHWPIRGQQLSPESLRPDLLVINYRFLF